MRRVTGQMPEQIIAQIARDRHEHVARDVARNAPQQIVASNECDQDPEGGPNLARIFPARAGERIGVLVCGGNVDLRSFPSD